MNKRIVKTQISMTLFGLCLGGYSSVHAVNLNYENLSFLEKPIATHIGDTTLQLNGLVDGAVDYSSESDTDTVLTSSFQVSAETQLGNSLTLGAAYFGQYASEDDDDYTDNLAAYLGGVWGTVSLGDVTSMVREETQRRLSVGNADLAFDGQLAELSDTGLAYIGRIGPSQYLLTVDEDGGFAIGGIFQRPIGNKDYRLSFNFSDSEYELGDGVSLDSQGLNAVAEFTYGSTVFDIGLGFEKLTFTGTDINRKYISTGVSRKIGVLALSAEAHFGDFDGQDEVAYSLGASYDIARGTSLNLGVNHFDSDIVIDGTTLLEEDTNAILSITYRF